MLAWRIMMSMLALAVMRVCSMRSVPLLGAADDVDTRMETPDVLQVRIVNDEADFCKTAAPKVCKGSKLMIFRPPARLVESSSYILGNLNKDTSLFTGELSGWPAFAGVTLETIRCKTVARRFVFQRKSWKNLWEGANSTGRQVLDAGILSDDSLEDSGCISPFFVQGLFSQQPWVTKGWSEKSPGFVYWYRGPVHGPVVRGFESRAWDRTPYLTHGRDIVDEDKEGGTIFLTSASLVTQRNFIMDETWKQKMTYHASVLLEWSHGAYTTVVELAWRNAVGSSRGPVNWYDEGYALPTELFKEMQKTPHMIAPWDAHKSEVRIYDVPAKNPSEWRVYLEMYDAAGPLPEVSPRFIDPHVQVFPAEPKGRSRTEIHAALLRYIEKADDYVETVSGRDWASNCQTFAADFLKWLTGEHIRLPTPMLKMVYAPHDDYFNES